VDDAGLARPADPPSPANLGLDETKITDAGLEPLRRLAGLRGAGDDRLWDLATPDLDSTKIQDKGQPAVFRAFAPDSKQLLVMRSGTVPVLLERLQRGGDVAGLPGVYVHGGQLPTTRIFAQDLDLLPLPEADLWASADPTDPEVWVPVQTRRGCPLACSYCSTPELEGTDVRMRSPALVTEHIARVAESGFDKLYFVDNTFNIPPSYALELCRRLKDILAKHGE
jgi:hypothetical protein